MGLVEDDLVVLMRRLAVQDPDRFREFMEVVRGNRLQVATGSEKIRVLVAVEKISTS